MCLNIISVERKINNGTTNPFLVKCDDNIEYVAKFPGNPEGIKVLINEYVCASLAKKLKLPIPDFEIAQIDNIDSYSILKPYILPINGSVFCSRNMEKVGQVPSYRMLQKVSNRDDILKIFIFDVIIGNNDRNPGNMLINFKNNSLVMIDHSHVFINEAIWDEYSLNGLVNNKIVVDDMNKFFFDMFSCEISNANISIVNEFINDVKNLSYYDVKKIIDSIPNDWKITINEKKALIDFIYNRITRVEEICKILGIERGNV